MKPLEISNKKKLRQFNQKIYRCLVCKTAINAVEPTADYDSKHMKKDAFWGIKYYEGAGDEFVDYYLCEVKVCPTCHFSSEFNGHFVTTIATTRPIELDEDLIENLKTDSEERRKLTEGKDIVTIPRTVELAVTSYEMAIETSRTIFETARNPYCEEAIRMASYLIKIATLKERAGGKPMELIKEIADTISLALRYKPSPPALFRAYHISYCASLALSRADEAQKLADMLKATQKKKPDPEVAAALAKMRNASKNNRYQ